MNNENFLEKLISPVKPTDFMTNYWAKKPFVSQGSLDRLPTSIATLGAKMHYIALRYKGHSAMTNGIKSPIMISTNGNNVESIYNMGIAVFMSDISPYHEEITDDLRKLETECSCKRGSARIGAFLAPKDSGLQVHYDIDDIISIQLVGRKRFKVSKTPAVTNAAVKQYAPGKKLYEELYPQSLDGFPVPESTEHEVIDMEPGTVLYIPKGTWHSTEASDEESISISIGFANPSALESILHCLRYSLLQDPEWRKPLYGIWGGAMKDEAVERGEKLFKNLETIIKEFTTDDLLLSESTELSRLQLMNDESIFVKEPYAKIDIQKIAGAYNTSCTLRISTVDSQHGEKSTLQLPGLPEGSADVFEWLSEQNKPFTLAQFKEEFAADDHAIKEMFDIAIRGKLIRMLWFPVNDFPVQKG